LDDVEVELPRRDPAEPPVLRLRRGAVLWGRVSTTAGEAVEGARVLAADAAARTDAEGSYRLSGVAEGEQRVEVQHESYRRVSRSLRIEPRLVPLFGWSEGTQRGLTGSSNRGSYFLAEELYDRSSDPYEEHNLADGEEQTVLGFRRKLADWLAVYYDPPNHPRYEYTLEFPRAVALTLSAPQRLRVSVDGAAEPSPLARRVALRGTRFVLQADDGAPSVVDLDGLELDGLVRCATTGLPLEALGGQRVRLNLALARTNCVGVDGDVALGPSDVRFRARLVRESRVSSGGGMTQELLDGLRSWGYVRDLDQARGARSP